MDTAAQKLVGKELSNGWTVVDEVPKDPGHTGGFFSHGYYAEDSNGRRGYLKAIDFERVMRPGISDPVAEIKILTDGYMYERDLLRNCNGENLSRIVKMLSYGEIFVDTKLVPYLILEIADGDVRSHAMKLRSFDDAWVLRTMHHIVVGLKQLHGQNISHQDFKPSNVLLVNDVRKLGDLGRSVNKSCALPHAQLTIAGARGYAAPEALYGYKPSDWRDRRLGCDIYQAGSLMFFMFSRLSLNTLLMDAIDDQFRPENWSGTYEQVLPVLMDGFDRSLDTLEPFIPEPTIVPLPRETFLDIHILK